ncbi:PAS domain S-box protein [Hymenobacter antarcticus]|uniref:PAS domain S-box-containing protein n=1 Tax=Hymenobacter antarcticus TaxID=486270 RepID=A0ABP7R673_9BACT
MLPPATPAPGPAGPHETLLQLRARAEQRRQLATQVPAPQAHEESQRLVQELQVHQIELEMQNEELLLAQAAATAAHDQYLDLYDFAPVGHFTLTAAGLIQQLNHCASQQLGTVRPRLVGRHFALFVAPSHRAEFGQFLVRAFGEDHTLSCELTMLGEDGRPFFAQLEALRTPAAPGAAPADQRLRLAVLDITTRREATDALAASETRLRKLFHESSDAVVLLQGHTYVDCNAAALRLMGARHREELVGHAAWACAPELQPDGRPTADLFRASTEQAIRTGSYRCQALMHRRTGEPIWVEVLFTPIELGGPTPVLHLVWRDITAAHTARQELRRSKEFNESLLDNTVNGIIAIDRNQRITAWNAEAARYFGRAAAEVLGRPLAEVLPALHYESTQLMARALAGERVDLLSQSFRDHPGRYDIHIVPLRHTGEPAPIGVLTIVHDVTERDRLAEEAIRQQLRRQQEVLAAILATQETERKRIAEALHNGLGQLLYATKLSLAGRAGAPASVHDSLRLLEEAIRATRTISFELTPGILEDFGLRTALEELVKRLAPARLPVRLHLFGLEQRLAPPIEIAVYRIVQELLNNVMKHAQASEVVVHLVRESHRLEVSVEDDGRGFEPAAQAAQPLAGIGLAGVRNRVALLGGELSVVSRLGRGTIISFGLEV